MRKYSCIPVLVVLFSASLAQADVVPVNWSTSGSFSSGLTFTPVSPAATPPLTDVNGNLLNINLGTITFPNPAANFAGTFSLTVTFVRPDGSADSPLAAPFKVLANVLGNQDELQIDFPDASLLAFNGTDGIGTFTFGIPDVDVFRSGNPAREFALTGNITGAALTDVVVTSAVVPEPGSIVLVCTVLSGIGLSIRGKKKKTPGRAPGPV